MTRTQNLVLPFIACCLLIFTTVFLSSTSGVQASFEGSLKLPEGMEQFLELLRTDHENYAGGVYAPGVFAFPIISQPETMNSMSR